MFGWVESVRTRGWTDGARKFGWRRNAEVAERAQLLRRMIALIVHGLRTKSYEQFIVAFSNPGREPDALQRISRKASFQMRISATCWYDATVSYAREKSPSLRMVGGGDDAGILVTTGADDEAIMVGSDPADALTPGRDARLVVRALVRLPGCRARNPLEEPFGVLPDQPL